jgi:hypothetical protein
MLTRVLCLLLCLGLEACDESKPQQTSKPSAVNEDAALLKDVGRASAELERRLLKSVSVQDGLVIIREPLSAGFFTYVLPATSPWVISCGIGLSVTSVVRCPETRRALATMCKCISLWRPLIERLVLRNMCNNLLICRGSARLRFRTNSLICTPF